MGAAASTFLGVFMPNRKPTSQFTIFLRIILGFAVAGVLVFAALVGLMYAEGSSFSECIAAYKEGYNGPASVETQLTNETAGKWAEDHGTVPTEWWADEEISVYYEMQNGAQIRVYKETGEVHVVKPAQK